MSAVEDLRLVAVPVVGIDVAWPQVLPLIQRMVDSAPDLELPHVWNMLRSGEWELWVIGSEEHGHEAIGITRLRAWGDGTAAYAVGVASNDAGIWRRLIPEWCKALKARGADRIIIEGRKGWERVVPGAKLLRQVYEIET